MFELVDSAPQSAVIKVVGVGGGGGNAVQHMVTRSVDGVDFVAANTDAQALKSLDAQTTLQIGSTNTTGKRFEFQGFIQVGTHKYDARVHWCRMQRNKDLLPCVQTHTSCANGVVQRFLM